MTSPPSGTVTFLFSDIEGSTKLAQADAEGWAAVRARHHAILREAIESKHGYVFQVIGDAFCAAFATAPDALVAALAAQRELQSAPRNSQFAIRVRMGLHTGVAEWRDGEYEGYPTLARVQRIMSAGAGGQVLLSQTVYDLVREALPDGATLRHMGEHRLKGIAQPERLYQLCAPDLPQDFPPLASLTTIPNNLPIQVTSFVGREKEIAEVKRLLVGWSDSQVVRWSDGQIVASQLRPTDQPTNRLTDQPTTRLLTLTGSGGTGKTRLSLQVAAEVLDTFKDGAWFVELAPLSDPAFMLNTVAAVLSVREQPGLPLLATLLDWLSDKELLLVLDNCEHLIDACAQFANAALHASRATRLLATSREALGIAGESAYRVPSLQLPTPNSQLPIPELMQYEAVRLFIDRATQALSTFRVTHVNAPAIAQICFRLDGIPLALELAAARAKALSVEKIAERLDDRFRLLTGGSRTALPRQQTLRALIDWSHNLLSEPERVLLRRLSVFAGGWTLEAAEEVCSSQKPVASIQTNLATDDWRLTSDDVLDLLTRLVDKSLVVLDEQAAETRYRLLETIRQYAREKLLDCGEGAQVRARHLEFYVRLAEAFSLNITGSEQTLWLNRLETEHDNVRTAIEWSLESRDALSGMRLAGGLYNFWQQRYTGEGLNFVREILSRPEATGRTVARARALNWLGFLEGFQGNSALPSLFEEALAIAREAGDEPTIAHSLRALGLLAFRRNDNIAARAFGTEALEIFRKADDQSGIAFALFNLGSMAQSEDDTQQAQALYEESSMALKQLGEKSQLAAVVRRLGQLALRRGDYERAGAFIQESLRLNIDVDDKRGIAACLTAAAALHAAQNRMFDAGRLCGAADALLNAIHMQMLPFDHEQYERNLAALRAQLDPGTFDAALAEGRMLTLEQAIALALETTSG